MFALKFNLCDWNTLDIISQCTLSDPMGQIEKRSNFRGIKWKQAQNAATLDSKFFPATVTQNFSPFGQENRGMGNPDT